MSTFEWREYALKNGMLACVLCGEPTGRGCPCGKIICFPCSIRLIGKSSVAWRCRECAAELVFLGEWEVDWKKER